MRSTSKKYEIHSGRRLVSTQFSVSPLQAVVDYVRSYGVKDAEITRLGVDSRLLAGRSVQGSARSYGIPVSGWIPLVRVGKLGDFLTRAASSGGSAFSSTAAWSRSTRRGMPCASTFPKGRWQSCAKPARTSRWRRDPHAVLGDARIDPIVSYRARRGQGTRFLATEGELPASPSIIYLSKLAALAGIHGVGLREIVAHSGGPRGSLGRFFPGGKTQLVTEAIDVALLELFGDLRADARRRQDVPRSNCAIVTPWRRLLVDHDFALGCPLAATICDAADNDSLRTHVSELFAGWRATVADAYTRFGAPQAEAEAHATVLVAALEGALIVARAQRTIEPLDTVERFFASRGPDTRRA